MMARSNSPLDPEARLARLERQQQRAFGILILLFLLAILEIAQRILPGSGELEAHRISLRGPGNSPRTEWSVWTDGTPAFRLNDDRGKARALWALRRDGTLSLRLLDSSYTLRAEMAVLPDGTPRFAVYGPDGRSRASMSVDEKGAGQIRTEEHP